jgi:hypothetical protein
MIKLFPSRENLDLVSGIPGGDGKTTNLFLQCSPIIASVEGYKGGHNHTTANYSSFLLFHGRLWKFSSGEKIYLEKLSIRRTKNLLFLL